MRSRWIQRPGGSRLGAGTVAVALLAVACQSGGTAGESPEPVRASTSTTARTEPSSTTAPAPSSPTTLPPPPFEGWVDPASVGKPYGDAVAGLLTFRGNPTRTYYGAGPLPVRPQEVWRFPESAMCSESSDKGETTLWCGTGWTGQPAVFERSGRTWVTFGAYDRSVHFVDGATGERILPDFPTGDIIKGSVTVDPDGFPLVYSGSRDSFLHVLAIDREEPTELWRLSADAVSPVLWNNDWDGSPLVLDDYLFEGGENSQLHIVKLNRAYDAAGKVTVAPELVFNAPGWDDELLAAIGGNEVSIENSVAIWGDTLYFANSGGLVQGWDIGGLRRGDGMPARTFRFWTGDDTDASVVVDEEGMLYVASEYERETPRAREVGQVMKLDPTRAGDPLVWSIPDSGTVPAGAWATVGLHRDIVIAPLNSGRIVAIDRATGEERWQVQLPGPTWGSPVIVDDVWIEGDCAGVLHGFDVSDTTVAPPEIWTVELGGCIESTPAVWDGQIYVGTRAGFVHALGGTPGSDGNVG